MDDRTCWLEPNASVAELHTAVARSNAVDRAFGFELSPDKCVVASFADDKEALAFAHCQGFKCDALSYWVSNCSSVVAARL